MGRSFPIRKLDSTDAIQLLLQNSGLSGYKSVNKLEGRSETLALTDRLDGLPLAIVIAAAFMRQTGTSIAQYLQYYQDSWSDLQSKSSPENQYQQGNILQTWMISYHEIQNRDPNAAKLLLLLARFDNRDIWYELVKAASNSPDVPDWLERAISSGLAFRIGVKPLVEFSILEIKQEEGSYAMHPVVQNWCFHISIGARNLNSIQLSELAIISVGYAVPRGSDDSSYAELRRRLLSHANFVHNGQFSTDNITVWEGFHRLGYLYKDQGKLQEAEKMYQRALLGREKTLGPDHTSTLNTVSNLGVLYKYQGKLREAEEMYQRALLGREKALGPGHTSTLNTIGNLGNLYKDQGKLREAEEMHQRALVGFENVLGPDHIKTRRALGQLYTLKISYKI